MTGRNGSSRNERTLTLAGDAARQLGIGVQTLHYYEREQLIPPPERTEAGYRLYTTDQIGRVAFIRKAQSLGLSLAEIREILRLAERGSCPCGRVQQTLSEKLDEVNEKLRELRSFRRELAVLVARSGESNARHGDAHICSIVEGAQPISSAPSFLLSNRAERRRSAGRRK